MPSEVNHAHPYVPDADFDYTIKNYYTGVIEGLVEPDIYNYSFGGYDGKFVINPETKEVLLFDRSHSIKFEFTFNTLNLTSFMATTPDGNKYYFDKIKQSYEPERFGYVSATDSAVFQTVPVTRIKEATCKRVAFSILYRRA